LLRHGRMEYGLERYRNEHPEVDILLLQPDRDDLQMFSYNIMKYSARRVLAEHGYRSALSTLAANEPRFRRVLRRHGIGLKPPSRAPLKPTAHRFRSRFARSLAGS